MACEVESKNSRDDLCKQRITSKQWCPTITLVPHCQLAGFKQNFPPLHRMYIFLQVKIGESHVIQLNAFYIWKPSAREPIKTAWTPLNLK